MNKKEIIEDRKVWTMEIPDVHPSLNTWTRMHFHVRNKLKTEWMDMVDKVAKINKIPKFTTPVEVFITYYHPRENIDLDNYTPKFILDGLKNHIEDDSIATIKKLGWTFKKSKVKKTKIDIMEFEEDGERGE